MLVFRCTQQVVKRFKLPIVDDAPASSGTLGDWYANLLNIGRSRFVLCQSERSLLPVILPARNVAFPAAFGAALGAMLGALGIRRDLVEREVAAANDIVFSRPRSRQVLGAMNDFAFNVEGDLAGAGGNDSVLKACLRLAEMPSKPLGYESPDRFTRSLFEAVEVKQRG